MDAGKIRLVEMINASKRTFNIPVYQRNYDWKKAECTRLFRDIENISLSDNMVEHFLGTIVYVVERTHPTFIEYVLIDGQQRITSIILLIKALYDVIEDENIKQDIYESFLTNRNAPEKYRIKLKTIFSDRDAFEDVIEGKNIISDSNIVDNYNLFKEMISASSISPIKLYNALNYIDIVYIELEKNKKSENPQMIFESLNSTGLSLSQADLIRNYLLMNLDYYIQEQLYMNYWLIIERSITNAKISDYFRDYLTMKTGRIPNKGKVYIEFKDFMSNDSSLEIEEFFIELVRYSKYYAWLSFSNSSHDELNSLLTQFREIKSTVIYPALLFILDKFHYTNELEYEDLISILKVFISYLYRRLVCGYATNALNKIFASFKSDFLKNTSNDNLEKVNTILLKKQGNGRFPRTEEFKKAFLTRTFYPTNIDKYTLISLERFSNKEKVDLSDSISIEHIMPQLLNDDWKYDLGDKYHETYSEYLHTIGNLTLTGYNPELYNKKFSIKKPLFKNSNISITREIAEYDKWDKDSIISRAERLFIKANKIWPINEEMAVEIESIVDEETKEYLLSDEFNFTNQLPSKLIIVGKEHIVNSWRDFLRTICDELYSFDRELFRSFLISGNFIHIKKRMASTDEQMRAPYKISEGLFAELHGSASELYEFAVLISEQFEMEDEISIVIQSKKTPPII